MKKYDAPICSMVALAADDIMNTSGELEAPKYGMVFEMIGVGDDSLMESGF
jgi:hypothetical protein